MTSSSLLNCTPLALAGYRMPPIGFGLWLDREMDVSRVEHYLKALQPSHLDILLDIAIPETRARLEAVMALCAASAVSPWLYVICDDERPEPELRRLAGWLEKAKIVPAGMLVTPRAYLKSYQPDGAWPAGVSPEEVRALARRHWPSIALGGGFPTCFTELNRCRPDPSQIDFITHATSPLVHDAEDHGVMESLESLAYIFQSARALAPGRPYKLTTSAIGAWTNPYGEQLTPNDGTRRVTLSDRDPRQRGLFGAAWQIGYVAHAAIAGVDTLTLSSLGPPFDIAGATPYPLFHVLRGLIRGGGQPLLTCSDAPARVATVGWQASDGTDGELWLANLSSEPASVSIKNVTVRALALLDAQAALDDAQWMDRLQPARSLVALPAFGVARLMLE